MKEFFTLVSTAIELNRKYRVGMIKLSPQLGITRFNLDFSTVHIDVGRGVGKSSYIYQHATEEDLIVTHSKHMKDHYARMGDQPRNIWSPGNSLKKGYENIYIDEPFLVLSSMRWRDFSYFYELTSDSPTQTYILLGK